MPLSAAPSRYPTCSAAPSATAGHTTVCVFFVAAALPPSAVALRVCLCFVLLLCVCLYVFLPPYLHFFFFFLHHLAYIPLFVNVFALFSLQYLVFIVSFVFPQ